MCIYIYIYIYIYISVCVCLSVYCFLFVLVCLSLCVMSNQGTCTNNVNSVKLSKFDALLHTTQRGVAGLRY